MQPIQAQSQTKDPWSGAQPYISQALGGAAGLYNAGVGGTYMPYTGPTVGAVDVRQQQGQNDMQALAQSEPYGSANLTAARGYAGDIIASGGLNAGMQGAAGQFQDIYNRALGNENPYLQAMLDTSNRRIGDRVNASMSGAGRYGSAAHTDVLGRALAEAADPVLAQDYEQRQQRQMQSTASLADLYNTGVQNVGKFSQLIPGLDEARFANSAKMMDLGQFYTNRTQADLNSTIAQYNAQQAYPFENLSRYNAIVQGAGGLGGSQITGLSQAIQQPTTMQRLFGGAAAGAGIGGSFGGPAGAGIGAASGGLLGLLG
jgi:hypothetical protein